MEKAAFAAGCFWGVQHYFDRIPGVVRSTVGYAGGHTENPTYEQVCSGKTGHAEAIFVEFDPDIIPYETLVKHFFHMHDPTQPNRQGPDIGEQYRSIIFYENDEQHMIAERVKLDLQPNFQAPIVTQMLPLGTFYQAESYHQKYHQSGKHPQCHGENQTKNISRIKNLFKRK